MLLELPSSRLLKEGTLIDSYGFAAGVAVLGEDGVEAVEAVGPRLAHDVALAAQHPVAFEAGEVAHVPRPSLRLGALVGQYQLSIVLFSFSFRPVNRY